MLTYLVIEAFLVSNGANQSKVFLYFWVVQIQTDFVFLYDFEIGNWEKKYWWSHPEVFQKMNGYEKLTRPIG